MPVEAHDHGELGAQDPDQSGSTRGRRAKTGRGAADFAAESLILRPVENPDYLDKTAN
jgi:hypothetical protein